VHAEALKAQGDKLREVELTPSAQVLAAIREHGGSFESFTLHKSKMHAAYFRSRPPSAEELAYFTSLAQTSLEEQAAMEREQVGDFDQFITDYRSRTPRQLCE
ncbi:MAG: glutamate--cysteine ligase, partial [Burkholderiales bacterium]